MARTIYVSRHGFAACPSCGSHVQLGIPRESTVCPFCNALVTGVFASDGAGILKAATRTLLGNQSSLLVASLLGASPLMSCTDTTKDSAPDTKVPEDTRGTVESTDGPDTTDGTGGVDFTEATESTDCTDYGCSGEFDATDWTYEGDPTDGTDASSGSEASDGTVDDTDATDATDGVDATDDSTDFAEGSDAPDGTDYGAAPIPREDP